MGVAVKVRVWVWVGVGVNVEVAVEVAVAVGVGVAVGCITMPVTSALVSPSPGPPSNWANAPSGVSAIATIEKADSDNLRIGLSQ